MICAYCGTELPAAAMFCGECGRAVASKASAKARPRVPLSAVATPSRWPSLVAEHQVDPMIALAAQPGLVEVDLLASQPIAIPVATAPEIVEPRATPPASPASQVSIPELLVGAELARADRDDADRKAADHANADLAHLDPELLDDQLVDRAPQIQHCQQCGAELAPSDIFCGECGFVRRASESSVVRPRDTATYDPFPWGLPRSSEEAVVSGGATGPDAVLDPDPIDDAPERDDSSGAEESAGSADTSETDDVVSPEPQDAVSVAPAEHPADASDVEKTRIVDRPARGDAFILQFSTGENLTVSGTGLIGRNPLAEPGEYFDSLVSIVDPGKSVSKTHLEFGQDGGQFWISDRYSANGTVVREPDRPARRAEAGKRYRVVRGTRVDTGEQFFIVS